MKIESPLLEVFPSTPTRDDTEKTQAYTSVQVRIGDTNVLK
jgi:hypothetical protein